MSRILPWLLVIWLFAFAAQAHELKLSDSELRWQGNEALWTHRVHLGDFNVKFGRAGEAEVKAYIPDRLGVEVQGKPCAFQKIEIEKDLPREMVTLRLSYLCPSETPPIRVHYDLFYGDPNHRHLMKLIAGSQSMSYTFDPGDTDFELGGESLARSMLSFLKLGLKHILTGYDHILFILALILGARGFKSLLWLVSAFTLAHSITLALATLGILTLQPSFVEPAIALSIVLLALLDLKDGERSFRLMIGLTFSFGLVHGLGFSYILQEANLKAGHLAIPLVFFNLGVELGQLLIVAWVYPLTLALKEMLGRFYCYFKLLAVSGIAGMGLYWFLGRVLP